MANEANNIKYEWNRSNSGGGGYITGLIQDPENLNILYARCDVGGVFKSLDYGKTFLSINNGMTEGCHHQVDSFAISTHDSKVLFRCSGEVRKYRSNGFIHKSIDGGQNWRIVTDAPDYFGNGFTRSMGEMIAVDTFEPSLVVAGSLTKGVFVSNDLGETWKCTGLRDEPIRAVGISPYKKDRIYVGTMKTMQMKDYLYPKGYNRVEVGRLYLSIDKGKTWEMIYEDADIEFSDILFSKEGEEVIYVAGGDKGIFKSIDGGKTFVSKCNGLPDKTEYRTIAADPIDMNTFYTAPARGVADSHIPLIPLYKSIDGGEHWTLIKDYKPSDFTEYHYEKDDIRPIGWSIAKFKVDLSEPNRLYMSNWFGVSTSEDAGQSWSGHFYKGIENVCIESIVADPLHSDRFLFAVADKTINVSKDNGRNYEVFKHIYLDRNYYCSSCACPSMHREGVVVYAVTNNSTRSSAIYRTEDCGENVEIALELAQGLFVQVIKEDYIDKGIFYALIDGDFEKGAGLLKSTDWGKSWRHIDVTLASYIKSLPHNKELIESELISVTAYQTKNACGTNQILCSDPYNKGVLYLAEWTEGIFRIQNNGEICENITSNLPIGKTEASVIISINVDEKVPGVIYTGLLKEGLWRTENYGNSWTKIYPKDDSIFNASSIFVGGLTKDELYVVCEPLEWSKCNSAVIYSSDRGETWKDIYDPSLGAIRWKGIAVNRNTGTIQAISCGNGAFYAERATIK